LKRRLLAGHGRKVLYSEMAGRAIERPHNLLELLRPDPNQETIRHTTNPLQAMFFLDRLLTHRFLAPANPQINRPQPHPARIALLLDHLEHLAPASAIGERDLIMMTETLSRWALDDRIAQNRHLIVMLADDIHQVAPTLYTGGAATVRIMLPRPEREERRCFLEWLKGGGRIAPDTNVDGLSGLTAGFNYADLESVARYAEEHTGQQISDELVRLRKAEIIRAESHGLLQVVEPTFGWEQVGGLSHVIRALDDVAKWLRAPEPSPLVPKGMLFVGPPGTGKSHVAQALARESHVNMVKLRDIQSMWVGESERNMTRVLEVARAFAPVIIFVDEIDQAYGQRGGGQGDSGVTARLFGKLLEFIGDNANRGRVVWIAASNRPDLIDAALVSRFDRIVPFLLPSEADRRELLLKAMPKIAEFEWCGGADPETWPADVRSDWEEAIQKTRDFSGREIELVVRRALELATRGDDAKRPLQLEPKWLLEALRYFKHSHDRRVYMLQTLLALRATNFTDFLPDPSVLPDNILRVRGDGQREIDWERVSNMLARLLSGSDLPSGGS